MPRLDNSQVSTTKNLQYLSVASKILFPVPKRHDPDASLETVDLNEDDDDLGGDDKQTLEAFLADDIPSVSPLPKDDEDQACGNAVEVTEDELLSVPAEGVSRAESMYYTPSDTLENLSETVAKQT